MIIGICGGSGSGKTTLLRKICKDFSRYNPSVFSLDNYFKYQAAFANLGSEHELCSVYIGQFNGEPQVNTTEVSAWRWISPEHLNLELEDPTKLFTPWLQLEWQRLNQEFSKLFIKAE